MMIRGGQFFAHVLPRQVVLKVWGVLCVLLCTIYPACCHLIHSCGTPVVYAVCAGDASMLVAFTWALTAAGTSLMFLTAYCVLCLAAFTCEAVHFDPSTT